MCEAFLLPLTVIIITALDWLQWDGEVEWTGYSGTESLKGLVIVVEVEWTG